MDDALRNPPADWTADIYVLRHGQSEHHINGLTGGNTDTPLTELGRRQAQALAKRMATLMGDRRPAVYSSTLLRAAQTAACVGEALDTPVQQTPELWELGNGVAKNLAQAEANKLRRRFSEPALDWVPYDDGESWRMMDTRLRKFMTRLCDKPTSAPLVVVTHGNAMIPIVQWWVGMWRDDDVARVMFSAAPASIAHLRTDSHGCRVLERLNDTGHLEALSQTD
jgi:probable phosphoglycerate mutase